MVEARLRKVCSIQSSVRLSQRIHPRELRQGFYRRTFLHVRHTQQIIFRHFDRLKFLARRRTGHKVFFAQVAVSLNERIIGGRADKFAHAHQNPEHGLRFGRWLRKVVDKRDNLGFEFRIVDQGIAA
jgi:hypothetical protein